MISPNQGLSSSSTTPSTWPQPAAQQAHAGAHARPPAFIAPIRPTPVDPLATFAQRALAQRRVPPVTDRAVTSLVRNGNAGEIVAFLLHLDSVVDINADSRLRNRVLRVLLENRVNPRDIIRDVLQCFTARPEDILQEALRDNDEEVVHAALLADETGSTLGLFGAALAQFPEQSVSALHENPELLSQLPFDLLSEAVLRYTPTPHIPAARLRHDMMELMHRLPSRCEDIMREAERLGCDDEALLWQYALDHGRKPLSPQFVDLARRKLAQAAEHQAFQPPPATLGHLNDAEFVQRVLGGLGPVNIEWEAIRAINRHPARAEAIVLHLAGTGEIGSLIVQHALDLGTAPSSKAFWRIAIGQAPDEAIDSFRKRPEAIDRNTLCAAIELQSTEVLAQACQCRPQALHERDPATGDTPAHAAARQAWDRRSLQICRQHGADIDAANLAGETARTLNPESAAELP